MQKSFGLAVRWGERISGTHASRPTPQAPTIPVPHRFFSLLYRSYPFLSFLSIISLTVRKARFSSHSSHSSSAAVMSPNAATLIPHLAGICQWLCRQQQ